MSLRNFVPSYPQLPVNGPPPPHHQTHRVQTLPVSVATAIQQQITQQQAAVAAQQQQQQQQQSQVTVQSNQSGNGSSAPPSHEYHVTHMPFQTPGGASLAPNFIRHMSNGAYPTATHQNPAGLYQSQGPPGQPNQQQPTNNQQNIQSGQQPQARLATMVPPTAPPTPPQQQSQQQAQYMTQIQQQSISQTPNGSSGSSRGAPTQYRTQPQQQMPRRQPQQAMNPQLFYQQQLPYGFVNFPGTMRTHPSAPLAPQFNSMHIPMQFANYYPAAPTAYGPIATVPPNGQRQTATPTAPAPAMVPQPSEYTYQSMDYQPITLPQTAAPPQKTVKKTGSHAIQIINPVTGKNIFDDDAPTAAPSTSSNANDDSKSAPIPAPLDIHHRDDTMEKDQTTAEPSTPVVSAMSDGPSVDITPKHQVNKVKKMKPPEPQVTTVTPLPIPAVPEAKPLEPEPEIAIVPTAVAQTVPQDTENNNTTITPIEVMEPPKAISPTPVIQQIKATTTITQSDVNDTNNNFQKVTTASEPVKEQKTAVEEIAVVEQPPTAVILAPTSSNNDDETDRAAVIETPQDSNNNRAEVEMEKVLEKPVSVVVQLPVETLAAIVPDGPIDYVEDQWSPANPIGKKYYTRDQLLKLKDQPIATQMPKVPKLPDNVLSALLKNNKEHLTNTLTQQMPIQMQQRPQFDPINSVAPKFMTQVGGSRGGNVYQKRPSQQGNKNPVIGGRGSQTSERAMIKLNLSLQDDVKLNESENAWKPGHLVKQPELTEEEKITFELLKKFRSVLNKLTPENFSVLLSQVKTYAIDTEERLNGVIRLVFEKAISEPNFATTYAEMCNAVSNIFVMQPTNGPTGTDKKTNKSMFRIRLITQCQNEFERHKDDASMFKNHGERMREIENETDAQKREELKANVEEEHFKLRQRAVGTVKFIGELYKIDMLTSKIMKSCINILMDENIISEETIECLCKLLTTIGGKMEQQDDPKALQEYFNKLIQMTHTGHNTIKSSRIRFMIQDLIDLRLRKWQLRRPDQNPKTIEQMQREADHEQQMINFQTRQSAKDDRRGGGGQNDRGGYNSNKRNQNQQEDGWSVQQNKSRSQVIEFNKFSIPSMKDSTKLGNPAAYQGFMTNKFSGLPVDSDDGPSRREHYGGSKGSSMERGDRNSQFYGNGGSGLDGRSSGRNSSNQGSKNSSLDRPRDNSGSIGGATRSLHGPPRQQQHQSSSSASLSYSGSLTKPIAPAQLAPVKAAPAPPVELNGEDTDKMVTEMAQILKCYQDDKYTMEMALEKFQPIVINKDVLYEIYDKYHEKKDSDRENLIQVIVELVRSNKVQRDDNRQALLELMENAPENICDVPLVYEYIAQYLGELLINRFLTFQDVHQISLEEIKQKRGEDVLHHIFTAINLRHGAQKLQETVADANCDLGQFIKDGNLNRWLEENKFTNMVRRGTKGIADVMNKIKHMLESGKDLQEINSYINSTDCTKEPNFIRQLTTLVIEHSCDGNAAGSTLKVIVPTLENLCVLLRRYIQNQESNEMQCLYAIQKFVVDREHPPGLLNTIFCLLFENDVLSLEAFKKWKDSDDPNEQNGKGVAIRSTTQFFTMLDEQGEPSDSEADEDGPDGSDAGDVPAGNVRL